MIDVFIALLLTAAATLLTVDGHHVLGFLTFVWLGAHLRNSWERRSR